MIIKYSIPVFCFIISEINALNCRTEGSLKSEELKKVYSNCVKQYESNNTGNSKNSSEQDWRDRGSDHIYSDGDRKGSEGNNRKDNNGRENARNWMEGRIDRKRGMYESDNGQNSYEDWGMNRRNQHSDNGQSYSQNERQNDRNKMNNNNRRTDGRNNVNSYQQNDRLNEQETFFHNNEYESESQSRNMYSNSNRRYKRGRSEKNSGQRSQYNPNTKWSSDDDHRENRNSNDSSTDGGKACAMHCFLVNLKMTGENGMPDRYLVTNAMTKDVRNEDLRDFLQESIEECFQILDNENTEDKCEFSKNLLICLSEKGRATCDDWKEDIQFT